MIYCLGEGAGAGGWSPACRRPAPRACSLLRGPRHTSEARVWPGGHLSSVGHGAEQVPGPICTAALHSLPHLRGRGDVLLPFVAQWLRGHVSLAVPQLMGAACGMGEQGQQRRVLWQGCTAAGVPVLARSLLVELLVWRRPWQCCRQWVAGGGAALP